MKSKSMIAKWVGALLGACLLLGAGGAQALPSVCSTITPAAPSVMLGSPSPLLTATCNNSPNQYGYKWKVGGALLTSGSGATGTCTGATCTVPATSLPAATTYTVEVTNNNNDGTGVSAASTTITVTPVPSDCLPTYGPVVDFDFGGASGVAPSVTLTANCNPGANRSTAVGGYAWTADSNPVAGTGPTITVAPPAEGTQYAVTNNTTVNSAKNPGAFYSGVPSCTLESVSPAVSSTAVTINSGASAVLLPTCDAATSIDWYVDMASAPDINIPAPAGGAVSPAATTAYYVVGNNSYGSSGSNVVTVTVNPPAPALPVPLCSLTASPLTISVGESTTLTATCPGATSFAWTGSGAPATSTTSTIAVTPIGSGPKTYTVTGTNGSGTSAAASVIVNVSALPLSACTAIEPASPSVTVGSPSQLLSATCSNTPTAWVWKLNGTAIAGCGTTASTCTVPAARLTTVGASYNVTVTANNVGGTGTAAASTAITVNPLSLSACTAIAPVTVSVVRGSNSPLLTATCNNTPTSYVWKVGTTTLTTCTGATCTVPAANLPTAGVSYTVTVTANNAGGTGTQAASKVIPVTAVALSACTAITPPTVAVAVGSPSPLLSATCSNTPTAWVWKLNGTAIAGCGTTASTCTVPAARLTTVGAAYTVTVTANNAGGTGITAASKVITVSSGTPTACPQTITEALFDYAGTGDTQHLVMNRGKAIAIKFTTDSLNRLGQVVTEGDTVGANVYKFINLSKNKCDFSYTSINTATRNGCGATGAILTAVRYTTGAPVVGRCTLEKNTTYYANIRNENALETAGKRGIDTCPAGATCGFVGVLYVQ